jgi:glycosyltransferase involved in cell wall biosynthesis
VRLVSGYASNSKVADLLANHHAVVVPYLSATQSGIIPLAFAAGRPVVVTNVGGLGEQIEDGLNGTVASSLDARGLADAIARMADHYTHLQPAAERSVPTWDTVAAAVTAVSHHRSRQA